MRLLLIRHGQTPANIAGQLDTAVPGLPLSPLGRRQAAAVPSGLGSLGLDDIGSIYVSTLQRTQETAAPLAAALDLTPTILDGLKEIQAGDLEMKNDETSQHEYNAMCFAWAEGDLDVRMPGGETGHGFFARYDAAVDTAVRDGRAPIAIVSHGAAIRTWVAARCADVDGGFAGTHQLLNTGLAVLESLPHGDHGDESSTGRRWRLVSWRTDPIGGAELIDALAEDPTGRATE
ncbi:histidine phosphatase family protein [Frondihabitans australicus]|uniref:Putative phosphoglycerate mutase n=1 Tax=Frondihabitans australicus TaxID=386892 RepID=A0A495IFQ1_9MICO|nr:histidine phosphatase family protein [Frondihabitans australicus]RKR74579.1 putative phosphoglycerate mutase [Frondihabitans australicus]